MMLTDHTVTELKKDFPILSDITYLDSAATSQKPKTVIEAIKEHYERRNANIHRGIYSLSQEATEAYDSARRKVASFIGCSPDEVIFTRSATEAINLVARCTRSMLEGDEIVLTEMEHHSNLIPWQQLAKREGMGLKFIKVKDDFNLDYESMPITKSTAVVAFPLISNSLGTINDAKRIIASAGKALTVIDAAQAAPHMKINVKDLGCDFLAFSSHKMLGPSGIGVLYGRRELLEKMEPLHFGGDMIEAVTYNEATWAQPPAKFEAGTQNIEGTVGLGAAIDYLEKIGMDNIAKWEEALASHAEQRLREIGAKTFRPSNSAGIVSFTLPGIHPHDLAGILDSKGICIRAGHHCTMPLMNRLAVPGTARASFYLYNTHEDVDKLIDAVRHAKEVLSR